MAVVVVVVVALDRMSLMDIGITWGFAHGKPQFLHATGLNARLPLAAERMTISMRTVFL